MNIVLLFILFFCIYTYVIHLMIKNLGLSHDEFERMVATSDHPYYLMT